MLFFKSKHKNLKAPVKNSGRQRCLEGFNSSVKGLKFYWQKIMTSEPYLVPHEQPEVKKRKMWRTVSLGDWWNLVLHQTLINCEGGVIRSNVMVHQPFPKNSVPQMHQTYNIKKNSVCPTGTNSWCTIPHTEEKYYQHDFLQRCCPQPTILSGRHVGKGFRELVFCPRIVG